MSFIGEIEKALEMFLGSTYDKFGISERVEDIIKNEAKSGLKMIVTFNQAPLFLTSNSEIINEHFKRYGGSLEVLTQNPLQLGELIPPIPDYVQVHKKRIMVGDVKIYYASKKIRYEFGILLNCAMDYVIRAEGDKFLLTDDSVVASKYAKYFEEMKKSKFVSRYDPRQDGRGFHSSTAL